MILAIILRASTDLCFKFGVNTLEFNSLKSIGPNAIRIALSPFIWAGLVLAILNLIVWAICLSLYDLSFAYPMYAISYVGIFFCGKLFFNEHLDRQKLIGMGFIIVGSICLMVG